MIRYIVTCIMINGNGNKSLTGACAVCDAQISHADSLEQSEIILCPECKSRLVVESIKGSQFVLSQAPEVEEDWGE